MTIEGAAWQRFGGVGAFVASLLAVVSLIFFSLEDLQSASAAFFWVEVATALVGGGSSSQRPSRSHSAARARRGSSVPRCSESSPHFLRAVIILRAGVAHGAARWSLFVAIVLGVVAQLPFVPCLPALAVLVLVAQVFVGCTGIFDGFSRPRRLTTSSAS